MTRMHGWWVALVTAAALAVMPLTPLAAHAACEAEAHECERVVAAADCCCGHLVSGVSTQAGPGNRMVASPAVEVPAATLAEWLAPPRAHAVVLACAQCPLTVDRLTRFRVLLI